MTIEEVKEEKRKQDERLLSLFIHVIRLSPEERSHAGFKDAEAIIQYMKKEVDQSNKLITKLVDSIP